MLKNLLTDEVFWCPSIGSLSQHILHSLVLDQGQHTHTGNTPCWRLGLHRKRFNMCPNLLHLFLSLFCLRTLFSHSLFPSPINLSLLSLPLSVCIFSSAGSPPPPLLGLCLSFFSAFSLRLALPASALLLCIPQYPPDRESSIFIGARHMCCFDSKGCDGVRGRKAATPWQQRHIIGGKTHPTINY